MIVIRPPEYLPRLAYLALAACADRFVLADTFQYSRQSHQNRTRLRNPQGAQWITVPLHGGQHGTPIRDVRIDHREPWARKHWRALEYNYRTTPYFDFYADRLRPLFLDRPATLGPLTCRSVETLAGLFDLDAAFVRASDLPGAPASVAAVLDVLGADTLLVPAAAAPIDAPAADRARVLHVDVPAYRQNFDGFVPGCSALDLLFNDGPAAASVLRNAVRVADSAPSA